MENPGTLKGSTFSVLLKEEVCVEMDGQNRARGQVLYTKVRTVSGGSLLV